MAATFDRAMRNPLERAALRVRAAALDPEYVANGVRSLVGVLPKGSVSVLEPGCGIGAKTPVLKEILGCLGVTDLTIDAIDIAGGSLKRAADSRESDVNYVYGDFLKLDDREQYDYIFLAAVWQYLLDTRGAIAKIAELLKPGGVAMILNHFYAEGLIYGVATRIFSTLYRLLADRRDVIYNECSIEEIRKLVGESCSNLIYCGDFRANLLAVFGRVVVLQKKS